MKLNEFTIKKNSICPNSKFEIYEASTALSKICSVKVPCALHGSNLAVGTYVKEYCQPAVAAKHAHASLMRMSNFWLRTVLCIDIMMEDFEVVFGLPSQADLAMASIVHEWFFPKFSKPDIDKKWRHEVRVMFNAYPFKFVVVHGSPKFVHYCHPSLPCKCKSAEDSKARVKAILFHVNYKTLPDIPQMKEWTKVSQCQRWHCFNLGTCGVLMELFQLATSKVHVSTSKAAAAGEVDLSTMPLVDLNRREDIGKFRGELQKKLVQRHVEETDFHALANRRVQTFRKMVIDNDMFALETMLEGFHLECLEYFTQFYYVAEQQCRVSTDGARPRPPLFTLMDERSSPAIIVAQCLSSMLEEDSSICAMLCHLAGFKRLSAWLSSDSGSVAHVRRFFVGVCLFS